MAAGSDVRVEASAIVIMVLDDVMTMMGLLYCTEAMDLIHSHLRGASHCLQLAIA